MLRHTTLKQIIYCGATTVCYRAWYYKLLNSTWDFDEKSDLKNVQSDATTSSHMGVTIYNAEWDKIR